MILPPSLMRSLVPDDVVLRRPDLEPDGRALWVLALITVRDHPVMRMPIYWNQGGAS